MECYNLFSTCDLETRNIDPEITYGASTFDENTKVLTYRGDWIQPSIDQSLVIGIVFAEYVTHVPDKNPRGVFSLCKSMTYVRINSHCRTLGTRAFSSCQSLVSVCMLPGSCVEIRSEAFCLCDIKSITIPASCEFLGEGVFMDCESLETVTFTKPYSSSLEFSQKLFHGCDSLTNIINTPALTSIPNECFSGCYNLTAFTIPETCVSLGVHAFHGTNLRTIRIPKACVEILEGCFGYCKFVEPFELHESCTIGESHDDDWRTAPFVGCEILQFLADGMETSVEELLRNKYRHRKRVDRIYASLTAMKICDERRVKYGDDGIINTNETGDEDVLVNLYRRLPTADLWREVLQYVK